METIFTKIINREIPAEIIYEDEVVMAFLDINPVNHGHTLVIPKTPFINAFDADAEIFGHMHKTALKIAQALKVSGLADGVNMVTNNGEAAGQEVFHSHLHIIPRKFGDESFTKPKHVETNSEEIKKIKDLLQSHL
jgi:histidine triad (HIT) family protein